MKMRYITVLLLLLVGCSKTPKQFPELVPSGGLPEGYSWELKDGPDFYVYHGVGISSNSGAGIYFGMHPNLGDEQPSSTERGSLGPVSVQWDVLDGATDCSVPFYRSCLATFRPSRKHEKIALHAWVFADTESEVTDLQESLKSMKLGETTYEQRKKRSEQSSGLVPK
jgi:hypothetical protein